MNLLKALHKALSAFRSAGHLARAPLFIVPLFIVPLFIVPLFILLWPFTSIGREALLDTGLAPSPATLEIEVRDSATGVRVPAQLWLKRSTSPEPTVVKLQEQQRLRLPHSPEPLQLRVETPHHRPLETILEADYDPRLPVTFWLDPLELPAELQPERIQALRRPGYLLLHGHVTDHETGQPLAEVLVSTEHTRLHTRTNARGYFQLFVPAQDPRGADNLPELETLRLSATGYQTYVLSSTFLHPGGDAHILATLSPGQGLQGRDDAHKLLYDLHGEAEETPLEVETGTCKPGARTSTTAFSDFQRTGTTATIAVPSSIKVGMGCSCKSCSSVSVYSLEQYVKNGLNDEWISSWGSNSLKAGAVAFRSYGGWYVSHPVSSSFDICSSTCCQVMDTDTTSSTNSAGDATASQVLTQDNKTLFRSEYSAENNACYCSNGYAGDPNASWPCLSDSVCSGSSCNGHGRGMCQWGSSRWSSQGKDYTWILNHYYNNNGNPSGMRSAYIANGSSSSGGGSTSTTMVLDSFESGEGRFATEPTYSGSTVGIATSSTAATTTSQKKNGAASELLTLVDNTSSSANWEVRFLSATGDPAQNVALTKAGGRLGLWVYTTTSGVSIALGIDDTDGTERSTKKTITTGSWQYLEWKLDDSAQWDPWYNGNGTLDNTSSLKLDAIWIFRTNNSASLKLYLDDVTYVK